MFPKDIAGIIAGYASEYVLLDWIDERKIMNDALSANIYAVDLLEKNKQHINYTYLCGNRNAMHLLIGQDGRYINWYKLSSNPNAIGLLKANPRNINWSEICRNINPLAIAILIKNEERIHWDILSENPSAMSILLKNIDSINWSFISHNTSHQAIKLIENNLDKINWTFLSGNPSAMSILLKNIDRINWIWFSRNPADEAISYLEANPNKIVWDIICGNRNPRAMELVWNQYNYLKSIDKLDITYPDKRALNFVSLSSNPNAIYSNLTDECQYSKKVSPSANIQNILEHNQGRIHWWMLAQNPSIFKSNALDIITHLTY
jgi:hypothetical protein